MTNTDQTPYTESHTLTLKKQAKRNLQTKVVESNLRTILESINIRSFNVRGWSLTERKEPLRKDSNIFRTWRQDSIYGTLTYEYEYSLFMRLDYSSLQTPTPGEFESILRQVNTRAGQAQYGKWTLTAVDDTEYTPNTGPSIADADAIGYARVDIPDDWSEHFAHLYGLTSHIERVRRALEAGQMSNWQNRYHCALVGPPGCGKSDICQSLKRALGDDAVMEFDATATTSAGALKELAERDVLPRIIVIEEIEKAPEDSMKFLLGVLDLRSTIRKVTARGRIERDTKLFAIATVNDVPLFQKLQAGALASRFANMIWFSRPSREQLRMILAREITRIEGDTTWIDPAIDYAESQTITDPRSVTAICLCGRDMLLTGEYQKMLSDTNRTERIAPKVTEVIE